MYDVWFDPGNCEGWEFKTFDTLGEALKFCENEVQSEIYKRSQRVPLAYNINFNIY